jgi:hypothetical protein
MPDGEFGREGDLAVASILGDLGKIPVGEFALAWE